MKNLILIRHAKSSWETPQKDRDRPLSKRGIQDAHLISSFVSKYIPKLYVVYSSPAKRARETSVIFSQNLMFPQESIIIDDDLYTFDMFQLENKIKALNNDYDNVILFGHNAALTNFVNKFGDVSVNNVTTSGFVSINFDVNNWSAIQKGKTQKVLFPRDLKNV